VGIRALIFVFAEPSFAVVFAEFGLVVCLDMILLVLKFAGVAFPALVAQEISTNSIALEPEEVLHVFFRANVDSDRGCFRFGEDRVECAFDLSGDSTVHSILIRVRV